MAVILTRRTRQVTPASDLYKQAGGFPSKTGGSSGNARQSLQSVVDVENLVDESGIVFTNAANDEVKIYLDANGLLRVEGTLNAEGAINAYTEGASNTSIWDDLDNHVDDVTIQYNGTTGKLEVIGGASTTFDALTDTPATKVANKWVKVNSGGTALEYVDAPATTFDLLTDTPATKVANKWMKVNASGDAIIYVDAPSSVTWGSITGTLSAQTDLQNALNAKLNLSGGTLTGQLVGDVSASTWAFQGKTNGKSNFSGIWFSSDDANLLLRDDEGNLNVRLDSDSTSYINGGNVGFGISTPSFKTHIFEDTSKLGLVVQGKSPDTAAGYYTGIGFNIYTSGQSYSKVGILHEKTDGNNRGKLHLATNNVADTSSIDLTDAKMTIAANGDIGIGTTTPTSGYKLTVYDTGAAALFQRNAATGTIAAFLSTSGMSRFEANSGYTTKQYINSLNSAGSAYQAFGIKTAGGDPSFVFNTNGTLSLGSTATTYKLEVNGTVNASDFRSTSDRNKKKNIKYTDTRKALENILKLKPASFQWKKEYNSDQDIKKGFIAQDVREVIPEAVMEGDDGSLGINPTAILAELVAANKALIKKVEALERRVYNDIS